MLLCLPPPLLCLPPRPALDDAGWRGQRHASTGTPEERKGGDGRTEGGREQGIGGKICRRWGAWRVVSPLALVSSLGPSPPLLSFTSVLFLSIQHYMRGPSQSVFAGRRGGGFGETTPSLNPPTAVDSKLKKVLLQTPISGLQWEANFKL